MKLHLSLQVKILIANCRYSKKGSIFIVKLGVKLFQSSVPLCRETCVTQSKPDLTKSQHVPPHFFPPRLLKSLLRQSAERCKFGPYESLAFEA